ncbi:flavin reductase family protein [Streptomyces sp. NBC_00249]|uniref:flavin reductase family protein n=1 Tax=Streptomyces sp. NBC_00249 TaxID=2975690 RepID=UPI00225130B5|nr:flavin reductase family protein [Streptomyces sp. NBC_00249]MCX5199548.1 flavin reductase family protein [Streptomyces sp. NBC_00249]
MTSTTTVPVELVDIDDGAQLRAAFGAFPTGVTVVTVGGRAPRGMTANSYTSVSLAPPLVLISVNKDAVMHERLDAAPGFCVSVLGAGQEAVARHFADRSRPDGAGQFETVDWAPGRALDAPLITGAVAHLECEKWRVYDGGDHTLFLGKVVTAARRPGAEALLFCNGRFREARPAHPEGRAA